MTLEFATADSQGVERIAGEQNHGGRVELRRHLMDSVCHVLKT